MTFSRKSNPDWPAMKSWLLERIEEARLRLEQEHPSEAQHNITRGEISAYRSIIASVEPVNVPAPDERDYRG